MNPDKIMDLLVEIDDRDAREAVVNWYQDFLKDQVASIEMRNGTRIDFQKNCENTLHSGKHQHKRINSEDIQSMKELKQSGMKIKDIAEKTGFSGATVIRYIGGDK